MSVPGRPCDASYLHCAYPSTLFVAAGDAEPLAAVCASHSHLIELQRDESTGLPDDRFQMIAVEQERVRALWDGLQRRGRIEDAPAPLGLRGLRN